MIHHINNLREFSCADGVDVDPSYPNSGVVLVRLEWLDHSADYLVESLDVLVDVPVESNSGVGGDEEVDVPKGWDLVPLTLLVQVLDSNGIVVDQELLKLNCWSNNREHFEKLVE